MTTNTNVMGYLLFMCQLLVLLPVVTYCLQLSENLHKVSLKKGSIWGKLWSLDDRKVQAFLGIPYAEPPIGQLRFHRPITKKAWSPQTLSATDYMPPCLQFMDFHQDDKYSGKNMKKEKEDCLYLNVFAPYEPEGNTSFAVLVWVHGGSFLAGSGDTGIDELVIMRNLIFKDVILVTLNYRLGPIGFFSTVLPELRGNLGLWDQIEALKWIQENIADFGGDPKSVTLMGESAGGASVSILAVSPLVQSLDLVHKAIIMSGSAAAGWAVQRHGDHDYDIENLFDYLTCEKKFNRDDLAQVFRGSDVKVDDQSKCNLLETPLECDHSDTIMDIVECMKDKTELIFTDPIFRKALAIELGVSKPVVDGEIIPYNIDDILKNSTKIPIMTGVAEMEWGHKKLIYYGFKSYKNVEPKTIREKINNVMTQSLKPTFNKEVPNRTMDFITDATIHNYISSKSSNKTWELTHFARALRNLESDLEFVVPCSNEAAAYSNQGNDVYLYSFEHVPKSPIVEEESIWVDFFGVKKKIKKRQTLNFNSAFHGLDHSYIFTEGYSSNLQFEYQDDDYKISHLWTTFITNFAKYGKPTPEPVDGILWPPYTVQSPSFLKFKSPPEILEQDFRWANVSFWTKYLPTLIERASVKEVQKAEPLTDDERVQLAAYKRAWWALWILVAAVAFVLWTIIICMVAQKCISAKSKPYKNIIVTNG